MGNFWKLMLDFFRVVLGWAFRVASCNAGHGRTQTPPPRKNLYMEKFFMKNNIRQVINQLTPNSTYHQSQTVHWTLPFMNHAQIQSLVMIPTYNFISLLYHTHFTNYHDLTLPLSHIASISLLSLKNVIFL